MSLPSPLNSSYYHKHRCEYFPIHIPFHYRYYIFHYMKQQGKGCMDGGGNQSPSFQSIEVMRKERLFIVINAHLNQIPAS